MTLEEWLAVLLSLVKEEKELTRRSDELAFTSFSTTIALGATVFWGPTPARLGDTAYTSASTAATAVTA